MKSALAFQETILSGMSEGRCGKGVLLGPRHLSFLDDLVKLLLDELVVNLAADPLGDIPRQADLSVILTMDQDPDQWETTPENESSITAHEELFVRASMLFVQEAHQ